MNSVHSVNDRFSYTPLKQRSKLFGRHGAAEEVALSFCALLGACLLYTSRCV